MSLTIEHQKIMLDVNENCSSKILKAHQGDKGTRYIDVTLVASGQPIMLTSGYTAVVSAGVNGVTKAINDCTINTINQIVTVELTDVMLDTAGELLCDLSLIENNKRITSATFTVLVQSSTVANESKITASTEYGALTAALTSIQDVAVKAELVQGIVDDIAEIESADRLIEQVSSAVTHVKSPNLFDMDAVNVNKTINSSGALVDSTVNSTSDIMECHVGDTIYITSVRNGIFYKYPALNVRWLAVYDVNMALLSCAEYVNDVTISDSGAAFFRIVIENSVFNASTKFSVTIDHQPANADEIDEYYDYYINSASGNCVDLINYLPSSFRYEKVCNQVEDYINNVITEQGNARYTIVLPEGILNFSGTSVLPYKVAIKASQGTIINVADNVTAFEWNAQAYPMSTIYDGDGCAFDGGGCRFILGSNSIAIKIDGTNADINTHFARRCFRGICYRGTDKTSIGIYYVPNHVYLIKHEALQFSNTVCIRWGNGEDNAYDSGENMSFTDSVFTHIPVYLCTYSFNARFTNCSFDYCESISVRPQGNTSGLMDAFMTDCHIERNKNIGGDGLILRGNASFFTQPNSNSYDAPPFIVKLGKGSKVKLKPSTVNSSGVNCVVMTSPYIDFISPRQIGYVLLNPAKNLVPNEYDGTNDIRIFHHTNYIGAYIETDGTVTLQNDLTGDSVELTINNNRAYEVVSPGIYTLHCSDTVSNMIVNSLY